MAKKDRRNLRRKKADYKKRFNQLSLQETLGIIVNIKTRDTKEIIGSSLVHSMKQALFILEQAENQFSDIYATFTSLSGDIRISIGSSKQFNQSFLDSSQTSVDSSDSKIAGSNSEIANNDSDTQSQIPQPDIITLDSDEEVSQESINPVNKCDPNEINVNSCSSNNQISNVNTIEPIASTSYAINELGKSPITPPIAIRKAKRSSTMNQNNIGSHNLQIKSSSSKKLTKPNKEEINQLIKIIEDSKDNHTSLKNEN